MSICICRGNYMDQLPLIREYDRVIVTENEEMTSVRDDFLAGLGSTQALCSLNMTRQKMGDTIPHLPFTTAVVDPWDHWVFYLDDDGEPVFATFDSTGRLIHNVTDRQYRLAFQASFDAMFDAGYHGVFLDDFTIKESYIKGGEISRYVLEMQRLVTHQQSKRGSAPIIVNSYLKFSDVNDMLELSGSEGEIMRRFEFRKRQLWQDLNQRPGLNCCVVQGSLSNAAKQQMLDYCTQTNSDFYICDNYETVTPISEVYAP